MADSARFGQLKRQIDRLRKDSLDLIASANRILYRGVQSFADKELVALNSYYKNALAAIRKADRSDLKGAAKEQIDLLQETVNTVIAHARESVKVIAEARSELAKLVQQGVRGGKVKESQLKKTVAPAKKAVKEVRKAAKKAAKQAVKSVKKTAKKAVATASESLPTPSPTSRAGRATSRAKKAANSAVETVSAAASSLSQNVSTAVSDAMAAVSDAVKPK